MFVNRLFFSIQKSNIEGCKLCLNSGVDINSIRNDLTPLLCACKNSSNFDIIQLLIEKGADVNFAQGVTPLLYATFGNSSLEVIKLLINSGSNINSKNKRTPLHNACLKCTKTEIIQLLLESGADINSQDKETPLHLACKQKETKIYEFLLQKKANPNIQNGKTPFHFVCENQNEMKIKISIKYKANPEIEDFKLFPYSYVKDPKLVNYILSHRSLNLDFAKLFRKQQLIDGKIETFDGNVGFHKQILEMRIGKENVSKIIELLKTRSQELIRAFLMFIYSERMSEEYEKQIGEILEETKISTKEKQMSSLREDLRKYYNDKESTDFTIISEGNRIKVHKSILMARSKLYYGMFVSVNDSSGQVNDYSGKSFKTIESLVKFLYFDDFDSDLPNSVLNELIDCVDYFQLNKYSIYALKLEEFRNKNSNNKCIFF